MTRVELQSLRKEFRTPGGIEVAVDDITLDIEDGEFVTFVGPSGCGKTTTLRCIAGLETPTSGQIRFDGEDISHVQAPKRNIGMMFQNIALYPHMTVRDNIAYPLKVRGVSKESRFEQSKEGAELMQVGDLLEKYPGELSGGQRQRTALARTVVQEPRLFLMDEPLSDLDAKLKVEVRKEMQKLHKRLGITTIYVTHDQEEALTMSDKVVVMNDGHVEQMDTPDGLYTHPANTFVAEFIGNPAMNFLTVDVESVDGESVVLSIDGAPHEFAFEVHDPDALGSTATLGFRPEAVSIGGEAGDLPAEVVLVERIGDRLLVTMDSDHGEIRATVSARDRVDEDGTVQLTIDKRRAHLFSVESGDLVAGGPDL